MPPHALELAQDYQRVQTDSKELERLLADSDQDARWQVQLRESFREFRRDLAHYFDQLDINEYVEQVEAHAPHMHERLVRLSDDQQRLRQELDHLEEQLARPRLFQAGAVLPALRSLLTKIQVQESRRNVLALDAYNVEPGAMD